MTGVKGGDHYFSASPSSDAARRDIRVRLADRELEVVTGGGVFSPQHLDTGTRVLLNDVPEPPLTGNALDLGCGWGPVALSLAFESSELDVWAVDVNERALELTRANAERHGLGRIRAVLPDEVPAEIEFDVLWSNPPIRIGKAELHAMLERWLPRLAVGGHAWLVVSKHLGADSLHKWIATTFAGTHEIDRASSSAGFRVLHVERTA